MSSRRSGNRIRGPQSALTDFLASHNISAAQIRQQYERRRQEDESANPTVETETVEVEVEAEQEDESPDDEEVAERTRKRKRSEQVAIEKIKKAKKAKDAKKGSKKAKKRDDDVDDGSEDYNSDADFMRDMYKKARPAPGQFAHCELCSKRFTVTPYSKEGPDGGLVCTPCGKELTKDLKAEKKAANKPLGRKRRKIESDKLDGFAVRGAKTLQQLCIEKVVHHHNEVDELGELPAPIVERLSAIFSKKRVLKPKTLPLFLRPDLNEVILHDAAYLNVDDYKHVFAVVPKMQKLVLGNACQFKDEAIEYMLERCKDITQIQLYAPNLVTNEMWHTFFSKAGRKLEVVKLKWLDAAFEDETVADIAEYCSRLKRLKLEFCRRIGEGAIQSITTMTSLEHLSLRMSQNIETDSLLALVAGIGPNLRTLSLRRFIDADSSLLDAIHSSCRKLVKFRMSENDTVTDAAFASLFTEWQNPPLTYIDINCTRDIDHNNPDGPEESVGMASNGFRAMMEHSGSSLKHLDIASCRHIALGAFMDAFNGAKTYPELGYINISFCNRVDTSVVAGIFKSCPALKQLVAFGCFDVGEVVVPRDIALIGVPKAQDAIEQYGVGIDVDEALGRMIEVAA